VEAFIAGALDVASVPLPSKGKGSLIIKTNKTIAAKKRPRRRLKKRFELSREAAWPTSARCNPD
jgi:hypothetical protein